MRRLLIEQHSLGDSKSKHDPGRFHIAETFFSLNYSNERLPSPRISKRPVWLPKQSIPWYKLYILEAIANRCIDGNGKSLSKDAVKSLAEKRLFGGAKTKSNVIEVLQDQGHEFTMELMESVKDTQFFVDKGNWWQWQLENEDGPSSRGPHLLK